MLLKESLVRWVSTAITGEVKLELRHGDDYTLVSTKAEHSAYAPEKLSMEKTESAFTPEDRIGALELQNLNVADNRALLLHYAQTLGLPKGTEGQLKELVGGE